jgi:hypothetical protein
MLIARIGMSDAGYGIDRNYYNVDIAGIECQGLCAREWLLIPLKGSYNFRMTESRGA